jgi:3-hydroxyacyl-CoA dehydrogenase
LVGNKRNTLALFEYLHRETGNDKFLVSPLLRQKVERGELGLISGKGWYDFSGESTGAVIQQRDELLLKLQRFLLEEGMA